MKGFTKEELFNDIKEKQMENIERYKEYKRTSSDKYFYEDLTAVCLWHLDFESRRRLKLARELEADGLIGLVRINKRQYNSPLKAHIVNID